LTVVKESHHIGTCRCCFDNRKWPPTSIRTSHHEFNILCRSRGARSHCAVFCPMIAPHTTKRRVAHDRNVNDDVEISVARWSPLYRLSITRDCLLGGRSSIMGGRTLYLTYGIIVLHTGAMRACMLSTMRMIDVIYTHPYITDQINGASFPVRLRWWSSDGDHRRVATGRCALSAWRKKDNATATCIGLHRFIDNIWFSLSCGLRDTRYEDCRVVCEMVVWGPVIRAI